MKKLFIILMLASLIILGGQCETTKKSSVSPFLGGTKGLEIKFDTENLAPPPQFDAKESVPLRVLVKNSGENNINAGDAKVRIEGILLASFGLSDQFSSNKISLRGIDKFTTEGQEQPIELGNLQYKESLIGEQNINLIAKLCYPYKTKAQVEVCMGNKVSDPTCALAGEKISSGVVSSAPIQLTSLTEEVRGSEKVMFKLNIENKGAGDVYSLDQACENIATSSEKNTVNVEVINPVGMKCTFLDAESNKGKIKLSQGKKTLVCEKTLDQKNANYKQIINLELSYKYIDKVATIVKIIGG